MEIEDTQSYFQNLADAYRNQYATQRNLLDEQRRQQMAGTMSQANTAGMLYSNFPQRTMIQYDTNTYQPALSKLRTAYQTGLDDLRTKGTQLANSILTTQEAIADLNNDIYLG